jgi:hypothetical protein
MRKEFRKVQYKASMGIFIPLEVFYFREPALFIRGVPESPCIKTNAFAGKNTKVLPARTEKRMKCGKQSEQPS